MSHSKQEQLGRDLPKVDGSMGSRRCHLVEPASCGTKGNLQLLEKASNPASEKGRDGLNLDCDLG